MKLSLLGLKAIVAILAIQIALMPVSFAVRIQIKTNVKLREHNDSSMERVGLLKKGSIVEIPDEFALDSNGEPILLSGGKPNLELTLNNWLRTGGKNGPAGFDEAGRYSYDGEKSGYFFPIRVTHPAKGSTVAPGHQNTKHFIALKYLAQSGKAMIVSDDAPIEIPELNIEQDEATAASADPKQKMEASNPCDQGLCERTSELSTPVRSLLTALMPALKAAESHLNRDVNRTNQDLGKIRTNFQNSCGLPLSDFTTVVKARAAANGVPPEILLALMTQESSGKCYALNSEKDTTSSIGLFQINSRSSSYPRCTNAQKNILKSLGHSSRLASGPRCLENPVINLEESIRILKDKQRILTSGKNGFDASQLNSTDLWRLTASAYNGGPGWVLQAKKDLEQFNAKNKTALSAYNWEDLRLFYMRRWLNRDQQAAAFGNVAKGRKKEFSILNLAYAENVIGRDATGKSRPALTSAWLASLQRQ